MSVANERLLRVENSKGKSRKRQHWQTEYIDHRTIAKRAREKTGEEQFLPEVESRERCRTKTVAAVGYASSHETCLPRCSSER